MKLRIWLFSSLFGLAALVSIGGLNWIFIRYRFDGGTKSTYITGFDAFPSLSALFIVLLGALAVAAWLRGRWLVLPWSLAALGDLLALWQALQNNLSASVVRAVERASGLAVQDAVISTNALNRQVFLLALLVHITAFTGFCWARFRLKSGRGTNARFEKRQGSALAKSKANGATTFDLWDEQR